MNWSVTLNGTTLMSNGQSITFSLTSGTYNYGIDLPSGYSSLSPSTGSIIVNTNETVSFTVTTSSNDSTGTADSIVMIMALAIIGAIIAIIVVCGILIVRNQRTQTIPPPPPPIYGQPAIQKINCMLCNQENNAYATYCIACGRQLRDPINTTTSNSYATSTELHILWPTK